MTETGIHSGPAAIDHLVLPVASLAIARERWAQLGFTVAAEARHPFGTANACIFFTDDTYLEPLAVASREECEAAAIAGNVFVARDQAFRFRRGAEGLSGFVIKSGDAEADHRRFVEQGFSAGAPLAFERPVKMPDGSEMVARFRLAFAADLRSPDFFMFAAERVNPLPADRGALTTHANGATGLAAVVLGEDNPSDFQYFIESVLKCREAEADSFGLSIRAANARIDVLTGDGLALRYGIADRPAERGLRGRAIVLKVAALAETDRFLTARGLPFESRTGRLVVPPAPGQGVAIAFEE